VALFQTRYKNLGSRPVHIDRYTASVSCSTQAGRAGEQSGRSPPTRAERTDERRYALIRLRPASGDQLPGSTCEGIEASERNAFVDIWAPRWESPWHTSKRSRSGCRCRSASADQGEAAVTEAPREVRGRNGSSLADLPHRTDGPHLSQLDFTILSHLRASPAKRGIAIPEPRRHLLIRLTGRLGFRLDFTTEKILASCPS